MFWEECTNGTRLCVVRWLCDSAPEELVLTQVDIKKDGSLTL